jgi:microcystin-dependent protein
MATPYLGEIRMFAGNFAPRNWAFCDGRVLLTTDYMELAQLIGNTYGGDGQTTFALPDLRGRIPVKQGAGFQLGAAGGVEEVTLNVNQMPAHSHAFETAGVAGNQISPAGNLPAESFNVVPYINDATTGTFDPASISYTGGSQPHDNVQPYTCVSYIICLSGLYPQSN